MSLDFEQWCNVRLRIFWSSGKPIPLYITWKFVDFGMDVRRFYTGVQRVAKSLANLSLPCREKPLLPGKKA